MGKKDTRLARAEELIYRPADIPDAAIRSQKIYAESTTKDQNKILRAYDK